MAVIEPLFDQQIYDEITGYVLFDQTIRLATEGEQTGVGDGGGL